jgi:phosphatidylglycerophosphate synthase
MYEYRRSIKSSVSDELINTWLIRPLAGLVVGILYKTPVTPNQVTIASAVAGLGAAWMYAKGEPSAIAYAGLLITLKDVLDSADGQLARAKQMFSRLGRFLDSISDFVVDVAVFGAVGWMLWDKNNDAAYGILAFVGLLGTTFRVSYHVFYQTSFLHRHQAYQTNRITEEVSDEDEAGDRSTLMLQKVFLIIYGWQDRLVSKIDHWCSGNKRGEEEKWYSDVFALRLSGFLGMGTELFLLMVFSVLNRMEIYLYVNLVAMNGLLLCNVIYRKFLLAKKVGALRRN